MGEKLCDVCGEACPLVDHWYMGGATGEYEAAMAKHWGLGYERSQAALVAANARAEKAVAEIVNEQRRFGEMQREAWKLEEALAAARRECDRYRKLCAEARQWIEVGIPRSAARNEFLTALAAPAAGEEKSRG